MTGQPEPAGPSRTDAWRQPPALPSRAPASGVSRPIATPRAPRTGNTAAHARGSDGAGTDSTGSDSNGDTPGSARLGRAHGAGRRPRALGAGQADAPRIVPVQVNGTLGASTSGPRKRKSTGKPPWDPATPPQAPPVVPRILPALPAAGGPPPAAPNAPLAPWERSPDEFAAAPVPADAPDWPITNSGPMYLWNPNASTSPQPAIPPDEPPDD